MFELADYINRGYNFLHNRNFKENKKLSSLMLYATDLCDSACKHCLIWAKRPVTYLPFETIVKIMQSRCITKRTAVGLEGGEFLLHPQADDILKWFVENHPNFDLFSNCLKPDNLIKSVKTYTPHRLYISLDGTDETYRHMRGKDGYSSVIKVIESLKDVLPVFVMFTLSPYNDFEDLEHVAAICKAHGVFLRVGIYNNIPFFDTIESVQESFFGQHKNEEALTFSKLKKLKETTMIETLSDDDKIKQVDYANSIPAIIKDFGENYDYVLLYKNWITQKLRLKCHSILDSLIVLPNGDVPICQSQSKKLGNIYNNSLDEVFNSAESNKVQQHYHENCNQCWVSYHRKYDVVLYRTFEKYFGKWATSKFLGYYKWDEDDSLTYKDVVK